MNVNGVNDRNQDLYFIGQGDPLEVEGSNTSEIINQIASQHIIDQSGSSENPPLMFRCINGYDSVEKLQQKANPKETKTDGVATGILSPKKDPFPLDSCEIVKRKRLKDQGRKADVLRTQLVVGDTAEDRKKPEAKKQSVTGALSSFFEWLLSD